jgi:hypothetical protein
MKYELLGLLGTIFVLLSFIQNDEKKIRKINIIGAVLFVCYGLITKTYSTALLNLCLCVIHIIKLGIFDNRIIKDRWTPLYDFDIDKVKKYEEEE